MAKMRGHGRAVDTELGRKLLHDLTGLVAEDERIDLRGLQGS
jgi:hypothetical protein